MGEGSQKSRISRPMMEGAVLTSTTGFSMNRDRLFELSRNAPLLREANERVFQERREPRLRDGDLFHALQFCTHPFVAAGDSGNGGV